MIPDFIEQSDIEELYPEVPVGSASSDIVTIAQFKKFRDQAQADILSALPGRYITLFEKVDGEMLLRYAIGTETVLYLSKVIQVDEDLTLPDTGTITLYLKYIPISGTLSIYTSKYQEGTVFTIIETGLPTSGEVLVDYSKRKVTFNADVAGDVVYASYSGCSGIPSDLVIYKNPQRSLSDLLPEDRWASTNYSLSGSTVTLITSLSENDVIIGVYNIVRRQSDVPQILQNICLDFTIWYILRNLTMVDNMMLEKHYDQWKTSKSTLDRIASSREGIQEFDRLDLYEDWSSEFDIVRNILLNRG